MANQLSFDVEFTREQILGLLDDGKAAFILVSGNYTHKGGGVFEMSATAQGCGIDKAPLTPMIAASCIRPCP